MKPESFRALAVLCSVLILTGLLVMSPSAGFLLMVLAALFAMAPAALGKKSTRIVGVLLLIASLAFAAWFFPSFRKEREETLRRGRAASPAFPSPSEQHK